MGIDIDASPEAVYDIVSDVTRTGEWAAETERCVWVAGVIDIATWRFDITPTESECHVAESWQDRRHPLVAKVTEAALGITTGRAVHNRKNMERSLHGLKRLAERESS